MTPICLVLLLASMVATDDAQDAAPIWRKGNTHTHTLWSDGDAAPETVVDWYVRNDYDFLVLSDHNILQHGEKWFAITPDGRLTPAKVEGLRTAFGETWPELREEDGVTQMRLQTLAELKERFEKPGSFLLIPGEEVTDRYRLAEVHINALNIEETIAPQRGESPLETIQNNIDAIQAHGEATGRPVLAHINHPNFVWSLTVNELANIRGEHYFEIYNGHRSTNNYGDETRPSTEQLWDIALTRRLHDGAGDGHVLYGLATDDAHDHHPGKEVSIPGRGWIMVRTRELTPEAIITAMDKGDFYASSGVTIKEITRDDGSISIEIEEEDGVQYVTEFLGTRIEDGKPLITGQILGMTTENPAVYTFDGDELYVRARITSTKKHPRPYEPGDHEMAWTQPHTSK